MDDEEHVTQLQLPSNVVHAPDGKSLADMMASGDLAAGFHGKCRCRTYRCADGRLADRGGSFPDLFPNAEELEAEWYRRTGIYPMHGTIVVKDSVLKEHPWVATSLFRAFSKAKHEWLAKLAARTPDNASDKKYAALRKIVGHDPLPYGWHRTSRQSQRWRTRPASRDRRRAACGWMNCSLILRNEMTERTTPPTTEQRPRLGR